MVCSNVAIDQSLPITNILSTDHIRGSHPERYDAQVGYGLTLLQLDGPRIACFADKCSYACSCSTNRSLA